MSSHFFKNKYFLLLCVSCILSTPFLSQAATYTFETDATGTTPANVTVTAGSFEVQNQATLGKSVTAVTQTGVIAGMLFNDFSGSGDQSVVWKQAYTNNMGRGGFTLRAQGVDTSVSVGAKQGYLFHVYDGNSVYIWKVGPSAYTALYSGSLAKAEPRWFKAIVMGNQQGFYYSNDGTSYTLIASTTDSTYATGTVQYTAGYGAAVNRDYIDDIVITNLDFDGVAPTVSSIFPVDNAANVSRTADLRITFSEPVLVNTGNVYVYRSSDDSIVETIDVTSGRVTGGGTSIITVNPAITFDELTGYYIRMDAGAFKDIAGNNFAGISSTSTWNFTTISDPVGAFAGGDGSTGNPFQIETCVQLQGVKDNLPYSFILNNDIDCYDTINWNNGAGFTQIGSWPANQYTGIFNGNNHTINDLFMGSGNEGLFGSASGTIKNVGLYNIKVESPDNGYIGTLVGTLVGGTVSQVFATGEVTGVSYTGGLIGWHSAGQVQDAYARVKVNGIYSGGLVGRNDSSTITNTYATGGATATAQRGLIGYNFGGTAVSSFYDGQRMGLSDTNGGSTPKTTIQMKSVATFTSATSSAGLAYPWDFVGNPNSDVGNSDIWNINPLYNDGYPYFTWQVFDQSAPTITRVSSNVPSGTYYPGDVVLITVHFSEPVTSTGSVILDFKVGNPQTCSFTVTHANAGTCSYTVQAGDSSPNLDVSVAGALVDRWGNAMVNFTPATSLKDQETIVIAGNVVSQGWTGPKWGGGEIDLSYAVGVKNKTVEVISTTSPVFTFTRDLKIGMTHEDVKQLQKYLNTKGYTVSKSGAGSQGFETTRFGSATRLALQRFQKSQGIYASGFFGPITRRFIHTQ